MKLFECTGLTSWPHLFQNLRTSRETKRTATYRANNFAAWLGNSVPMAMKHDAMATMGASGAIAETQENKKPRFCLAKTGFQ